MKKKILQKKMVNLGLDPQSLKGGVEVDVTPLDNPSEPQNYIYCAGIYCVSCVTIWHEINKRYVRICTHFIKTRETGQWL